MDIWVVFTFLLLRIMLLGTTVDKFSHAHVFCPIVFQNTILPSHQQCMGIPIPLNLQHHLLLSAIFIKAILVNVKWILIVVLFIYLVLFFLVFFFFLFIYLFYFTIFYRFCHTLTWIRHGCTCVPHPEPPSNLPPHPIPPGSSQCTSPEHPVSCIETGLAICFTYANLHVSMPFSHISHLRPLPQSPKDCSIHLCLFCCLAYRDTVSLPSF